jgi:hypothetical protein
MEPSHIDKLAIASTTTDADAEDAQLFYDWQPTTLRTRIALLRTPAILNSSSKGELSSPKLRIALSRLQSHTAVDTSATMPAQMNTRQEIVTAVVNALEERLLYLMMLEWDNLTLARVSRIHARSGLRHPTIHDPQVSRYLRAWASHDELIAVSEQESVCYKDLARILINGTGISRYTNMPGELTFFPSKRSVKHKPRDPSFAYTKEGGFNDRKQGDDEAWFRQQIEPSSTMVLSVLERRWLLSRYSDVNIIDGRFLLMDPQYRTTIGSGAFGRVESVVYRKPGVPGTISPLSSSPIRISGRVEKDLTRCFGRHIRR